MARPFTSASMSGATCLSLLNDLWELCEAGAIVPDTDGTLAANSDVKVPSQKAVKTYVDALLNAMDALQYKGVIDCSANPNYPAASAGHLYKVSVAGKIGGGSGTNVEAGDLLICAVDSTASGTQAGVGASWGIVQTNLDIASGVAAFLANPTSALMAAMLTDETGSGAAVFGTHPTVTNPEIAGAIYRAQPAPTAKNGAATLTIAELLTKIINYTGNAQALTLPTGTNIEGGVVATLSVDFAFDFHVINTGTGTATVTTNTNLTLVGTMTVAQNVSAHFRVRKTSTNNYTIYRLA
jgi:hypothetical protein